MMMYVKRTNMIFAKDLIVPGVTAPPVYCPGPGSPAVECSVPGARVAVEGYFPRTPGTRGQCGDSRDPGNTLRDNFVTSYVTRDICPVFVDLIRVTESRAQNDARSARVMRAGCQFGETWYWTRETSNAKMIRQTFILFLFLQTTRINTIKLRTSTISGIS